MKKIVRNSDIIDSQIDDEMVMMDVDKGNYFGLDPIASSIWNALEKPKDIDQLITTLRNEYDISESQCRADVEPFIENMTKANLLSEMA